MSAGPRRCWPPAQREVLPRPTCVLTDRRQSPVPTFSIARIPARVLPRALDSGVSLFFSPPIVGFLNTHPRSLALSPSISLSATPTPQLSARHTRRGLRPCALRPCACEPRADPCGECCISLPLSPLPPEAAPIALHVLPAAFSRRPFRCVSRPSGSHATSPIHQATNPFPPLDCDADSPPCIAH